MVRLSPLFVILVYTVSYVQGSGGKELPVPISDVLERLVDLEKRLLIQEQKNVDLEKRLLEQETLNKAQEEIIQSMSSCDCTPKENGRPYVGADSVKPYPSNAQDSQGKPSSLHGQMNTSLSQHPTQKLQGHLITQSSLGQIDSNTNVKRDITGPVAFYSYMSHTDMHPKPNQTIVFDHVVSNSGGNFDHKTGTFFPSQDGVYVFSWTVYCSNGGYLVTELVVNSKSVGAMLCSGQGADNLRHTTGVAAVALGRSDSVYVRTHPTAVLNGVIWSALTYLSSFTGFQIS